MLDMSWGELMVIGGVALIVIGPKDLPKALRTVGQMTTKVRRLAGEFQSQFNEAMREAELEDVKKDLETINRDVRSSTAATFNPIQTIRDELKTTIESRSGAASALAEPAGAEIQGAATAVLPASSPEIAMGDIAAGHSAGGSSSTAFAAEEPLHPDSVAPRMAIETPVSQPSLGVQHHETPVAVTPLTEVAGAGLEQLDPASHAPPGRIAAPDRSS